MIVDFHAHLWDRGFIPPVFYKEATVRWAARAPGRTPEMIMPKLLEGMADSDGKMFVDNMDRAGVDVTIINTIDIGIHWCGEEPEVPVERQLQFYGELHQRYPKRLYVFAFIDPRRNNTVDLLDRAVREFGCVGCGELSPEGFYVTDEIVQPVFKRCVELGVPVFIHTRSGHGMEITGDSSMKNTAHPLYIKGLQTAYPDLVIILGHAGYPVWWEEAARVARGHRNCYLELSNWDLDMADPQFIPKLACMRDMVGAEHILFGSDQTSGARFCGERSHLPQWVNFFKKLPETAKNYGYQFAEEEVELILGGNAQRILHLQ